MSTPPLIIGIHGFARKPAPHVLADGWRAAIKEGLRRNCGLNPDEDAARLSFDFELVYWADQLHPPLEKDPEPYLPADGDAPLPRHDDGWIDELYADLIDVGETFADLAMQSPRLHRKTGWLLERVSRDCERYNRDSGLRETVRERLESTLVSAVGRKILVLGHSMGSVIAYEVLRGLERHFDEPIVEHLIGLGSPMGFPFLTRDLELRHGSNRMPDTAKRWSNLTDRRDLAAIDAHLKDDFGPSNGGNHVEDDLVINTYLCPLKRPNRHKAYGYLRTPELSVRVAEFLND